MSPKKTGALNAAAVQAANDKLWEGHKDDKRFWAQHPKGMLTLNTHDYQIRKEWMNYYKEAVAVDGSATKAIVGNGKYCVASPAAASPAPTNLTPPPPPPPPDSPLPEISQNAAPSPPPGEKTITCALVDATLKCQHGRKACDGGELQVVAPGSSDTITCSSQIAGTCGSHPIWEITGERNKRVIGTTTAFWALNSQNYKPVETESLIHLPFWLGNVAPWQYWVNASSCSGASRSFVVSAYPADEVSVKLTNKFFKDTIEPVLETINKYLSKLTGVEIKVKFFEGAIEYSAKWAEEKNTYRAFYNWSVAGELSPVLGIEGQFPLTAPLEIPDVAGGGVFLVFSGEVNFKVSGGQNAPDSHTIKGEAAGKVLIGVKASLFVLSEDFMSAAGTGYTGITGTCEPHIEDVPKAEMGLVWEPLSVKLTFQFWFSSQEHTLKLFNDVEIGKWVISFADEPKSAGEESR